MEAGFEAFKSVTRLFPCSTSVEVLVLVTLSKA